MLGHLTQEPSEFFNHLPHCRFKNVHSPRQCAVAFASGYVPRRSPAICRWSRDPRLCTIQAKAADACQNVATMLLLPQSAHDTGCTSRDPFVVSILTSFSLSKTCGRHFAKSFLVDGLALSSFLMLARRTL